MENPALCKLSILTASASIEPLSPKKALPQPQSQSQPQSQYSHSHSPSPSPSPIPLNPK
ncbi:hypothetical protein K504DRAFT_458667 [Pleomassaria siparia CBS 279.74]|uniref:Uncharacterized protein n=1 Tax=Pleomassaria siparia CBS 279.74 TaxID=1314801 RepID=A0A6G1K3Y0_9PLEO|nr:hypothetical protein K504DRAFT_458667 [Pleomassaria siparia CBS 279.74]